MSISLTRLSGGNTPADGSDPRTFPAIWNASATAIENAIAAGGGASVTISTTAPADPAEGDMWWNSDSGDLFVYYDDGDSEQWVSAASPKVFVSDTAPTGYDGQLWLDSTDGSMYVYYTDPGGVNSQWIGAVSRSGGILQVVSTTKTDTYSASVATGAFTTPTGFSASITPRSTSSKILVLVNAHGSSQVVSNSGTIQYRLKRDSTSIAIGDASGSRARLTASVYSGIGNGDSISGASISHLDSPSTTSTLTYSIDMYNLSGSTQTLYMNRSVTNVDSVTGTLVVSSITLIEVAG